MNFGEFAAWAGPRLGLELGLVLSKLIWKKHEGDTGTKWHKQNWKGVAKMLGKPASQFVQIALDDDGRRPCKWECRQKLQS